MTCKELEMATQMEYSQYCKYLQSKYGVPPHDYMNENFVKNRRLSRAEEGLQIHHIFGDRANRLSDSQYAKQYPIEYQKATNLCYCDYLEHMLLHMLIAISSDPYNEILVDGYKIVVKEFVPILNDVYSGFKTRWRWLKCSVDKIIDQKDIYLDLVTWFVGFFPSNLWALKLGRQKGENFKVSSALEDVFTSYHAKKGLWDEKNNEALYKEIWRNSTTLAGGCVCPVDFSDSDQTICSQCLNPVCRNE